MVIFKFRNLNTGQATPLPPGEFTIGREDDAYIHLEDGSVSRRHAKLFNQEDGLYVEDIGSSNGTAAHGAYLTSRTKIAIGDVVHIGSVPFRVDPEVAGEVSAPPSAGMRAVNRTYMHRDTERLPMPGETPRVVASLSTETMTAPPVRDTDADAEDLNAITIREPEAPDPIRLPIIRPGLTPLPRAKTEVQLTPASKSQSMVPAKPQMEPTPSLIPVLQPKKIAASASVAQATAPLRASTPTPEKSASVSSPSGTKWGWLVLIFLAGMGTGLLLGLYFAKLFLEMGGKGASLP